MKESESQKLKNKLLRGWSTPRVIIHSQVAADTLLYFNENGYTADQNYPKPSIIDFQANKYQVTNIFGLIL